MKLNVTVKDGVNSSGFDAEVADGDNVIDKQTYWYGFNCSWNRMFATREEPYVSDILQGLVDRYDVDTFEVLPGRNVFIDSPVAKERLDNFKNDYCKDLLLADGNRALDMDFADAVASLSDTGQEMEQ